MPAHRASCGWLAVTIAALCVAAATPAVGDAVTVRDASGRAVAIRDASRIVSVGGAVTEILYALGLESRVIAVDSTSLYPPRALAEKPNVGYMRQLSAEGVLGLGPSLVLAAEGAGPKETIAVLETAAIPFVRVPDQFTGDRHRREDPADRGGDRHARRAANASPAWSRPISPRLRACARAFRRRCASSSCCRS